ncbi:MAG: endoglucanase, partial [Actinomycetota bacterium]
NYDGNHSTFGDTAVQSDSSDERKLAVFAAQKGAGGVLTVMVINKTSDSVTAPLKLTGFTGGSARVFRYAGHGIDRLRPVSHVGTGLTRTYPARSVTLYETSPG